MFGRRKLLWHTCIALLICLTTALCVLGQEAPKPPKTQTPDEVVRVFTELVQTDVMVFDKQGNFVNGLKRDNFEIKIDGHVRPIQFFEQVSAGSSNEEMQLAAARGSATNSGPKPERVVPLDRGRTVFFYIDDFHLDARGFHSSRKMISDFIDKEMGQNDQASISSATGQIGFLQQLTSDRTVLHTALERLNPRFFRVTDADRPAMTEYEAMLIDNNDMDVFEFFVNETIRVNGRMSRDMAAGIVRNRAQAILSQAAAFANNTLSGLEQLVRNAKELPGRKILFFVSNGFLIHNRRGDAIPKLQRITSAAAKSGVVIYSIDAHGLAAPNSDISTDQPFDPGAVLSRSTQGEQFATQDGLNALARDTGGRPIFNTNDFRAGVTGALKETSVYYLLAWTPDPENKKPGRFRNIQVNVAGRPDLVVRVRKGFFDVESTPVAAAETKKEKEKEKTTTATDEAKALISKLRTAILAPYPITQLPLLLAVNYYETNKGATVATSVQIPGEFLTFFNREGKTQAVADITGVWLDDKGQNKGSFFERLVTTAPSAEEALNYHGDITYTNPANLPPGLYQVRIAVRDEKSGRTGSAHAWIEIPDLSKNQLALSSLLMGERASGVMTDVSNGGEIGPVLLSPSRRFRQDSMLRFLIVTYNAMLMPGQQQADLAVQIQVIRDDQPVLTTALRKVNTDGIADLKRIPYAAEIPLSSMQPGRYLLKVTLIDRNSKQSASRQSSFDIY